MLRLSTKRLNYIQEGFSTSSISRPPQALKNASGRVENRRQKTTYRAESIWRDDAPKE